MWLMVPTVCANPAAATCLKKSLQESYAHPTPPCPHHVAHGAHCARGVVCCVLLDGPAEAQVGKLR
jgi:hypothetical protein